MIESTRIRSATAVPGMIAKLLALYSRNVTFRGIFTTFGIFLILVCWGALWSYLRIANNEKETLALTQLENTAIAISQSVANDVGQIDLILKLLAESKKVNKNINFPLYEMRHVFALNEEIFHVSFTDADGNVRDNTFFTDGARRVNIADREHFSVHRSARSDSRMFISKPVTGRGTGKYTIQFSRGIYGDDGRFLGAMVAGLSPETFMANLQNLNLGQSSGIALLGHDDIIKAKVGSFSEAIGSGFRERTRLRILKTGKVEITEVQTDGASQLVAEKNLPGYDLKIIIVTEAISGRGWVSTNSAALNVAALLLTAFVTFLIVVGHRQIAVEQLRIALKEQVASNELQRNFISMASHEFRTPLAIIDSSAQKLTARARKISPEDIGGRAKTIRGAVKRMTDLMESILALAKMEQGRLELKPSRFELGAMLTECVARTADLNPGRRIVVDIVRGAFDVRADRLLLEQAMSNLLSNAIKYSPIDKPISVTSWSDGAAAMIEIADQGIGVHEFEVDKLFSRFFRAKTAEGIAGTGIGLYFVKLTVEMHGGTISVRSKLGAGTTFTIRLPVASLKGLAPVAAAVRAAA